jgi:glycosyltransferase involved in cell wall biosynthesis
VFGLRASGVKTEQYGWLSTLAYRLEASLSGRAALVIANSSAGRDDAVARGIRPEKIAVVPNGVDTQSVRPDPAAGHDLRGRWGIPEGAFVIGMVARLDPMKDHRSFLSAAAEFARSNPDAHFVCIGGGPDGYRDELAQHAHSLGLTGRVTWTGELPDAVAAYVAFDIATLSSAFGEGFSNSISEAMACERPVVATDVGEAAALVDGYGEVVPPKRPDLLYAAWMRLRERQSREPQLGAEARRSIEQRYGVEAMVRKTEELLIGLCAPPRRRVIVPKA